MFAMARSSGKMREGGKERDQVNIITIGKKRRKLENSQGVTLVHLSLLF